MNSAAPEVSPLGISVILANYNHGRYLRNAVGAILAQDTPPLEIILIDDGSTDDSGKIIGELASSSPLIRVLRNRHNKGLVAAQIQGLAIASGELIHLAAADDAVLQGFFCLGTRMLRDYPAAGLFCGDATLVDGHTGKLLGFRPAIMPGFRARFFDAIQVEQMLGRFDNWTITGGALIRRSAMAEAGGLDHDLASFADGYLVRKISLTRGFCYAPHLVSEWRVFPTGASRKVALDVDRAVRLLEAAYHKIESDPRFPPWYARTFATRWRFSASRLALQSVPVNAAMLRVMSNRSFGASNEPRYMSALLATRIGRLAYLTRLWFVFRPYRTIDLAATIAFRCAQASTWRYIWARFRSRRP